MPAGLAENGPVMHAGAVGYAISCDANTQEQASMTQLTETLALVAVLGLGAQWLGWRFKIPAIVLLTLCGLLLGPVFGIVRPSEALGEAFQPLIKLGVAAILFEGGLNLRLSELKKASAGVNRLITVAVALSLVFGAAAARWIGGLSWPVAVIFGAIVVVTGPTVILPLLRQARLRRRPASYLKWEGIVNDPTGALLAVAAFEYFVSSGQASIGHSLVSLALGLAVAGGLGGVGGWLLGRAYLAGLVPEYLKGSMALAAALGVYALSNLVLEEAGLVAATVMGLVLGNMGLPSITELRRFKESVAVLLVSGIFLLLTADLDPQIMLRLDWRSVTLLAAILLLVRPLAVGLATLGAGMSWQERALVGWIAPRGVVAAAVAGVFGPALAAQGYAGGELLLPLVFALILITVVVHGFSLGWLARRLGLSATGEGGLLIAGAGPWSTGLATALHKLEVPVLVADSAWHRLRHARLAGIPVYFGELLSEQAESSLELGEVRSLLAVTSNDAYNALVCAYYAAELGRQRVYQLPAEEVAEQRRLAPTARGLTAFAEGVRFEDLERNWYGGWTFQGTNITEDFGQAAFLAGLPQEAVVLLVITAKGAVRVIAAEQPLKAEPGDRVLWFGRRDPATSSSSTPEKQT
jgi:NhaP-type Na+/H+ or K+/H+ antiporter